MIPVLSVSNLGAYSLQVAAVVAIGGGALWALRVQSPRARLACLRAMLVACFALPFVAAVPATIAPQSAAAVAPGPMANLQTTVIGQGGTAARGQRMSVEAAAPPPAWFQHASSALVAAAPLVLLGGIAARLLWLAVGLMGLARLRRHARPIAAVDARRATLATRSAVVPTIAAAGALVGARADFLGSAAVTRPVTFGVLRPAVLLPESFELLDETEQVAIATHELLHVRRRDWLQTLGEELLRAVFWFHPAVWWLLGQIDLAREQVVDQEVVALTERRQPYVNALVRLALIPAGPVLRPASLFLGRGHLLKRVALLSREVRMSRWRLAVSVVVVAAAVAVGGHLVVQAIPLTAVAPAALAATVVPLPAVPAVPPPAAPVAAVPRPAGDGPTPAGPAPQVQSSNLTPRVLQSYPPNLAPGNVEPGTDAIVTVTATVGASGAIEGAVQIWADQGKVTAGASDPATADRVIDGRMLSPSIAAQMHAALDALRTWRFEGSPTPAPVHVGFNFGADQTRSIEPVRVGGGVKQPVKVKDVRPVYPEEAQNRGVQGVVILEMLIDGSTGIPAQAVALRPVDMLTMAAMEAALRWRFAPTPEYPRVQMTVTVNFTLGGGVVGGVAGGVQGGVAGGVVGGVVGGITGSTQLSIPAGWPAPIRVGGNIKPPTRTLYVPPVYPPVAASARVQGVVIVEVLIGPDGKVADAKILRSIPLLDQAALDAVRQWQFTPTLLNLNPVPVIMTCTVNFTLEGQQPARDSSADNAEMARNAVIITSPIGGGADHAVYRPGPEVTVPKVLSEQKPVYEATAYQEKVQGTVVVEAVVGTDGTVQDVKVVKALDPRLDQKAIEAAYKWRFQPGTKNGAPVPVLITIELTFKLV